MRSSGWAIRSPYLAIVAIALAVVVYCAFSLTGSLAKLLFIAGAIGVALMTWRAWTATS